MSQNGRKILVVSNSKSFGGGEKYIIDNLKPLERHFDISYIVHNDILYQSLNGNKVNRFSSNKAFSQSRQLKKIIKVIEPDLVIFNGGNLIYYSNVVRKHKSIYIRHTTNASYRGIKKRIIVPLNQWIYKTCTLTIHVSTYSMNEQHAGNSITILNAAPPHAKKEVKTSYPLNFLFCARLVEEKGIKEVVDAFKQIDPSKATLTIAGTGSLENWLKQNITDNIHYLGFCKDVDALYQNSDALILLSSFENCPLSIVEAMSYGLPIIATSVGGIPELVENNENGFIIEKSSAELVETISKILTNPSVLAQMGQKSHEISREKLNLSDHVSQLAEIIENTLGGDENRR